MAGRCSAPSSLRRETVERLDGRPRHDLILREPAKRASRRTLQEARRARWSVLRRLRDADGLRRRSSARRPGANGGHAERDGRPENPAQTLEKVDSAPGIAPDPQFSTVATGWNLLRDATLCVAPQHEGGERLSAAAAADNRPEILLQTIEKVDSAPGFGSPADTASQSGGAPGLRLPSARPSGAGPPKVRAVTQWRHGLLRAENDRRGPIVSPTATSIRCGSPTTSPSRSLFVIPNHDRLRMPCSQGISLDELAKRTYRLQGEPEKPHGPVTARINQTAAPDQGAPLRHSGEDRAPAL